MESTINIPAALLLDAEIIKLGRERAEVVKEARGHLYDAQNEVERAREKVDEALVLHKGGESAFEVKLAALNAMADAMSVQLLFGKVAYKWEVKIRHEAAGMCSTMSLPLPDAPQWVEDLWSEVNRAKAAEHAAKVQLQAAESAAHPRQVQEDATLIIARRLVSQ